MAADSRNNRGRADRNKILGNSWSGGKELRRAGHRLCKAISGELALSDPDRSDQRDAVIANYTGVDPRSNHP